ncbi:MAG: hypothetical protein ACRDPU_00795, partial [Thermoleophilia bacterium]
MTPAASAGLSGDGAPTLGGGGALTTQPDSLAGAEVTPSETLTVQSGGAEKKLPSSLNAPFPSAVVERAPGVPVTIRFATAPLPSMRTLVPCSSARLIEIAAWAGPAAASTPNATRTPARHRGVRNFAPIKIPVREAARPELHRTQPLRARGDALAVGNTRCRPLWFTPPRPN